MTVTPADAARLLAVAAAFDRRTIGKAEALAWADVLQDLEPRECEQAIRAHYAETSAFLMPAHVRQRVRAAHDAERDRQESRKMLSEIADEAAKLDREAAHRGYLLAMQTLAAARGYSDTKIEELDAQRAAQAVRCPWCKASPGMPCRNFDRTAHRPHPSRMEIAAKQPAA